jgi:hypothetical protein
MAISCSSSRSERTAAALLIVVCTTVAGSAVAAEASANVEDIHVVRSLRLSRVLATDFCSIGRTGFGNATVEDRYDFRVVVTKGSDGKVVDASATAIGGLHACFGPSSDPLVSNFFAEGTLGNVSFIGRGDCRQSKKDFPEPGLTLYRCYLDIEGLPTGYVGGMLTTNTVTSRQIIGEVSDPPGYTQPSIATVRLWKARRN